MVVMGYCSDCGGLRHNIGSAGTRTGYSESRESSRNNEGWIRDEGEAERTAKTNTVESSNEGENAGRQVKVYQVGSYPGYETPWVTDTKYMSSAEFQDKLSLPPHNTASWFREMSVSENGLTEPSIVEPRYGHLGGGIEMRIIDPNAILSAGPWTPIVNLFPALPA
jgi:hypothetical protein